MHYLLSPISLLLILCPRKHARNLWVIIVEELLKDGQVIFLFIPVRLKKIIIEVNNTYKRRKICDGANELNLIT